MRTSLAIACLAGVALASKSKSYRNKHTADTADTADTAERPADPCLTKDAWNYLSDTACDDIWMAWDDYCYANMTDWIMTDECNQAEDDIWGVPDQAPAPEDACDKGYWPYESDDPVCNEQWIAFDDWCGWWGVPEDLQQECVDVDTAAWDRINFWSKTRSMQKTQMQEKHILKMDTVMARQPMYGGLRIPIGPCMTQEAFNQVQGDICDLIWRDWRHYCVNQMYWIAPCDETYREARLVPARAAFPTFACDIGYYGNSVDQKCNDQWINFDKWCLWVRYNMYFINDKDDCNTVNNGYNIRHGWNPIFNWDYQKTQTQKKHSIKERKRAGKKHQQTVVETTPVDTAPVDTAPAAGGTIVRPAGDCLNWDAREYKSDTTCDATWRVWDEFCVTAKSAECVSVRKDMQGVARQDQQPPLCSYLLDGDQEWCRQAWDAYLDGCWSQDLTATKQEFCDNGFAAMYADEDQWRKEIQKTDAVMRKTTMQRKHELKKSAAGKHALERTAAKERSGKKASVNLAASSSAANDGQYASGVAMGAAVGAAAALGALVAISKCNKGRVDDFQRV